MEHPANNTLRLLPLLLAGALLAGCTANKSDLEQFVRDERAKPGGAIEPLPTPRVFDTFTYKAGERRSPFKVDLGGTALARASGAGGEGGGSVDDTRPREYLEDFPLDALKMVGDDTELDLEVLLALVLVFTAALARALRQHEQAQTRDRALPKR